MIAYRQPIRPGDVGSDVLAVKRAMQKMGVKGAGGLALTRTAGPAFVDVLHTVERQHGLAVDNVYGPKVHAIIAPKFDLYGVTLYKSAAIRKPSPPPAPTGDAATIAKQLLIAHAHGTYRAENSGDLRDIQATALGKAVWSQGGYWVHVDRRPLALVLWLIERGFTIGTYAICSDHHWDGPHGHSGGLAIDIESINRTPIGSSSARDLTLKVARLIRNEAPTPLHPAQLICGGYGGHRDSEISALSLPAADSYYGSKTMSQHCNHIHAGYFG